MGGAQPLNQLLAPSRFVQDRPVFNRTACESLIECPALFSDGLQISFVLSSRSSSESPSAQGKGKSNLKFQTTADREANLLQNVQARFRFKPNAPELHGSPGEEILRSDLMLFLIFAYRTKG